jgi:hypothetical protein
MGDSEGAIIFGKTEPSFMVNISFTIVKSWAAMDMGVISPSKLLDTWNQRYLQSICRWRYQW